MTSIAKQIIYYPPITDDVLVHGLRYSGRENLDDYLVSEKLDGIRCIVAGGRLSRQGKLLRE